MIGIGHKIYMELTKQQIKNIDRFIFQDPNQILGKFVNEQYQVVKFYFNGAKIKIGAFENKKEIDWKSELMSNHTWWDYPDFKNDWNYLNKVIDKLESESFQNLITGHKENYYCSFNRNLDLYEEFICNATTKIEAVFLAICQTVVYLIKQEYLNFS